MTAGAQFADYHLLRQYFEDPSRWGQGIVWSPTQFAQVEGHVTHLNAVVADEGLYKAALDPEHACPGTLDTVAGDPGTRYDDETNPAGVRCSVLDTLINQLGPRPESVWGAEERAAGRGFGGVPFANAGVLYGLEALREHQITTAQFVDLNEAVGGLDVDSRRTDERTAGDTGSVAMAYRTGLVNEANHLDQVAMLNFGGPDPGIAHDYAHAFWTEERLQRDQGHTDNRVMWFGLTPLIGDPRWANEALLSMDRWLRAVERDRSAAPLARKIVARKPAGLTDRCSNVPGVLETQGEDDEVDCVLPESLQLRLSTPREIAGDDVFNDRLSCRLRPLERSEVDVGLPPDVRRAVVAAAGGLPRRRLRLLGARPRAGPRADLAHLHRPRRSRRLRRPQPPAAAPALGRGLVERVVPGAAAPSSRRRPRPGARVRGSGCRWSPR